MTEALRQFVVEVLARIAHQMARSYYKTDNFPAWDDCDPTDKIVAYAVVETAIDDAKARAYMSNATEDLQMEASRIVSIRHAFGVLTEEIEKWHTATE